jgi:streptogramin lyase
MFSAARVITMVVVVVLGTGALLFASGQEPSLIPTAVPVVASPTAPAVAASPTPSPVAVEVPSTAAPSTRPLTGLVSRLVTEVVAPGVLRVVGDGHRELSAPGDTYGDRGRAIAAGPDGSVWIFGLDSFFRLGEPTTYPAVETLERVQGGLRPWFMPPSVKVGPDGTLWALYGGAQVENESGTRAAYDGTLRSFDGTAWTDRLEHVHAFDITPDGVVWTTSGDGVVGRLDSGARDVGGAPNPGAQAPGDFAVTGDGVVWIHEPVSDTLVRIAGDEVGGWYSGVNGLNAHVGPLHAGPGDTLWAYQEASVPTIRGNTAQGDTQLPYFVRFDPSDPSEQAPPAVYTQEDGVPLLPDRGPFEGFLGVSPDGSLWMAGYDSDGQPGNGLQRWDGRQTTPYLEGDGVFAFAIGPDGTVWVQAHDGLGGEVRTYVIPGTDGGPP